MTEQISLALQTCPVNLVEITKSLVDHAENWKIIKWSSCLGRSVKMKRLDCCQMNKGEKVRR